MITRLICSIFSSQESSDSSSIGSPKSDSLLSNPTKDVEPNSQSASFEKIENVSPKPETVFERGLSTGSVKISECPKEEVLPEREISKEKISVSGTLPLNESKYKKESINHNNTKLFQ